jgi:hypothetical protein
MCEILLGVKLYFFLLFFFEKIFTLTFNLTLTLNTNRKYLNLGTPAQRVYCTCSTYK